MLISSWETLVAMGIGAGLLAGVLLLAYLVHRSTRKLTGQLRELLELRGIRQTVQELSRWNEGSTNLAGLERELVEMKGALHRVESHLRAVLLAQQGERAGQVEDVIADWLTKAGYEGVTIPTDLSRIGPGPTRVRVEARKNGTAYKGHVVVQKNKVVEGRLLPTYEAFP